MAKIAWGSFSEAQERSASIMQEGAKLVKKADKTEAERKAAVSFVIMMACNTVITLLLLAVIFGFFSGIASNSVKMLIEAEQTGQTASEVMGAADEKPDGKLFLLSILGLVVITHIYSVIARKTFAKPWGEYYLSLNNDSGAEENDQGKADR